LTHEKNDGRSGMSERHADHSDDRWDELLKLGKEDPALLELTTRARDALDDLAEYLARKALATGAALPADLLAFLERRRGRPLS
jgi:hypothetical protein